MPVTRIRPGDLLLSGSNVGIGTDTPNYNLEIQESEITISPMLMLRQDSTGDAAIGWQLGTSKSYAMGIDNSDSDKLKIGYYAGQGAYVSDDTRLTIDNDGNVGLGETSPSYNLHVSSTGDAALFLEADTDNSGEDNNPFIKLSQDNTAVQSIIGLCGATDKDPENVTYTGVVNNNMLIGTTTNYGLQLGTNDNVRMTIENSGGIKLVSTKDATTASSANLYINSSSGLLARSTSDRRGKKDITDIVSSLEQLCQLRPVHFYDKNDENNEIRLAGLVADEVEAIFPDLVPEKNEATEIYRSVAYDRLGAYIVNAIKEIKQRLEDLESGS